MSRKISPRTNHLDLGAPWLKQLSPAQLDQLKALLAHHGLSLAAGDVQLLDGKWYVTHSGLLRVALNNSCHGIHTEMTEFCDPVANRWIIRATVYKTPRSKGFVGYGDADPTNVSPLVHGAEMRVAETRAVNRALRKAYGIGICSVEELGSVAGGFGASQKHNTTTRIPGQRANAIDHHEDSERPLRDRLFALIRQHQLDPALVKRYALEFCGTESLRQASREQVETFVNHLSELAAQGRDQLLAHLAPYAETKQNKVA